MSRAAREARPTSVPRTGVASGDALCMALPKGRLLPAIVPLLGRAGLPTQHILTSGRRLFADAPGGFRFLFLKPDDVPTYIEHGTCDLGIVGRDVLLERGHDLFCPLDLRVGRCRIVVAGRRSAVEQLPPQPRVATKYLRIAREYFAGRGQPVQLIPLSGSVELAAVVGLADLVVDIVETGETLRQNHLDELDTICEVSAILAVNRTALKLRKDRIGPLIERLRSAACRGAGTANL